MGTSRVLEVEVEDVVDDGVVTGANVVNSSSIGASVVVDSISVRGVVVSVEDQLEFA